MVREIINIQLGRGGNRVGQMFWETLSHEHLILSSQDGSNVTSEKQAVYFNENSNGKFEGRSIFIGTEDQIINQGQKKFIGHIFSPDNFFCTESNPSDIFPECFNYRSDFCSKIIDCVRKEAEKCDFLQGFQMIHCLGGRTGSGLACFILKELRDEFPDTILSTFSMLPEKNINSICEPINCVLSLHHLTNLADEVFCFENDKLEMMVTKGLRFSCSSYGDYSYLIAHSMSGITGSFRFHDQVNSDMRKLYVNHVTFPKLHFLTPSFVPHSCRGGNHLHGFDPLSLSTKLFDDIYTFTDISDQKGVYMNASVCFRGRNFTSQILNDVVYPNFKKIKPRLSIKTSFSKIPTDYPDNSASMITNHTSIKQYFMNSVNFFQKFLQYSRLVQIYCERGSEYAEFEEVKNNLGDLINDYEMIEEEQ